MSSSKGLPGFLRRCLHVEQVQFADDLEEEFQSDTSEQTEGGSSEKVEETPSLVQKQEEELKSEEDQEPAVAQQGILSASGRNGSSSLDLNGRSRSNSPEVGNSDRGSISSLEDSAYNQARSPPVQRKQSYRESRFSKILNANVVPMSDLRKLSWNGIPSENRGMAWKLMLGYLPANKSRRENTLRRKRKEYRDTIAQHYDIDANLRTNQEQETLRQVLVDVPRTAPEVPLFRNERIRRALSRLLYIWAMRHPASSYVQGINDLATPLFAVFLSEHYDGEDVLDGNIMVLLPDEKLDEVEADCYWCLTSILAGIQDHYTADQPGVQRMVMRLEELVGRIDADLSRHLRETGIQFLQFAFRWMNCLLLREFNLSCVIRLWDTYIAENGFEGFHVYVCAAFLCQFSSQLQSMEFDQLFGFMQNIPTDEWSDTEVEMLLSQAYVLSTLFGGSDAHLIANNANNMM